jgi:hypothetical protein
MWAIVKTITTCLNLVVNACVMNQSRGHSLVYDSLSTKINLNVTLEFESHLIV